MADAQIKLSALWVALMLSYIWGDVLRIFSGDAHLGKMGDLAVYPGHVAGHRCADGAADPDDRVGAVLPYPINRWANIVVAVGFFLFNLIGLPTYPGAYDKFRWLSAWASIC